MMKKDRERFILRLSETVEEYETQDVGFYIFSEQIVGVSGSRCALYAHLSFSKDSRGGLRKACYGL